MQPLPPIGFWSYATTDEQATRGRLSRLRADLANEIQLQVGHPAVRIFQDAATISPGAAWEQTINEALAESSFFIPIITPGFLQSEWCTKELFRFRAIMEGRGRKDLIFPLHYQDVTRFGADLRSQAFDPKVLTYLRSLQWVDFRQLQLRNAESEEVRQAEVRVAKAIVEALRRDDTQQAPVFDPPPPRPRPVPPQPRPLPPPRPVPIPVPKKPIRIWPWAAGGLLLITLIILVAQHRYIATHRYLSGQVEVPAGVYRPRVETSPLLTLFRQIKDIGNPEILLSPEPAVASLPAYFIDRTEVTNGAYRKFLASQKPGSVKDPKFLAETKLNDPDQPVVGVDWNGASLFCAALGKRLPSGDEWERAARGQDGRLYPWGNSFDAAATNTQEGPVPLPTKVGSQRSDRSPEGVMDLGGNVREWTADTAPRQDGQAVRYVRGASYGTSGMIYGLGFLAIPTDPLDQQPDLGFRCAADTAGRPASPADMVLIPAGTFRKGSEDQPLLNLARRFHLGGSAVHRLFEVREQQGGLPAFGMDRTEVTNAGYRKFLEAMGGTAPGSSGSDPPGFQPDEASWKNEHFNQPDQPVVGVTWNDANSYCQWRGGRLPTDSEWERAAAGPGGARYPWGDQFDPDRCNTRDALHPRGATATVGQFDRCTTATGILDMVGNADEWTATDAAGEGGPVRKRIRGGGWADPGEVRGLTWFAGLADPHYHGPDIGFRCAADTRRSWLEQIFSMLF